MSHAWDGWKPKGGLGMADEPEREEILMVRGIQKRGWGESYRCEELVVWAVVLEVAPYSKGGICSVVQHPATNGTE